MHYHRNTRLTLHQRIAFAKKLLEQREPENSGQVGSPVSRARAGSARRPLFAPSLDPARDPVRPIEQAVRLRRTGLRIAAQLGLSTVTVSRILRRAGLHKLGALDPQRRRCAVSTSGPVT